MKNNSDNICFLGADPVSGEKYCQNTIEKVILILELIQILVGKTLIILL